MQDELLDIVNDQDQIVGQMLRSDVYAQNTYYFRVVNEFIINSQGQLWIPRRNKNKKLFPSCLDASMSGHVMAGETYQQAFERELYEELNLKASDYNYIMAAQLNPIKHNTSAFMNVYLIPCENIPNYNQQDFSDFFWLKPKEILQKLSQGDTSKGDLPKIIQFLIDNQVV